MALFWILFILTACTYSESVKGLKLVNNGYEDLYVVIQEAVPESVELLGRIQVSNVFYSLTLNPRPPSIPKVERTYYYCDIFQKVSVYTALFVHCALLRRCKSANFCHDSMQNLLS